MNKLLTIYIPTYNRGDLLWKQIESIFWGLDETERDLLEVIVSNNGSPKDFARGLYPIKYIDHSENIGAEGNYSGAFAQDIGIYFWLLSDDDTLKPGAVKKVLAYLKDLPIHLQENLIYFPVTLLPQHSEKQGWTQDEFVRFLNFGLGKISNVIYSRHYLKHAPVFFDNLFTRFAQLSMIFESAKDKCVQTYCLENLDYFIQKQAAPIFTPNGYVYSLYGFVCACRNLKPELFRELMTGWWAGSAADASNEWKINIAPTQALMCFSLLLKHDIICQDQYLVLISKIKGF
jgi:glycosyltransferase involved in cell wall biosynthesis